MSLQSKLEVFGETKGTKRSLSDEDEEGTKRIRSDESESLSARSIGVCKADARLRREPKCKGKYDLVQMDVIDEENPYCLKGLCLEESTMRGIMGQSRNATGNTNPLRAYMTDSEWKEARFDYNIEQIMRNDPSVTSLRIRVESSKLAQSLKQLAEALRQNTTLKKLNLSQHNFKKSNADLTPLEIKEASFYPLAVALKEITTLTALNMSRCVFDNLTCVLLNEVVKYNTGLKVLKLDYAENFNVSVGLSNLGLNRGLTLLRMVSMNVTDSSATILAHELAKNTTLNQLDLAYNYISSQGAIRLAMTGLLHNRTLEGLKLTGNDFDDEGAYAFCIALESNNTLQKLFLRRMGINSGILEEIEKQLQRNIKNAE